MKLFSAQRGVTVVLTAMAVICLARSPAEGMQEFKWKPITEEEWSVKENPAKGIRDAVILSEKITADDTKWLDDKCYLIIHRRIKIFNSEGRKWGDVTLPTIHPKQKLELLGGRTVYPGNREVLLEKPNIVETEVLKAKGISVKQKSFSMPGITDGCIIEYYIKYRLPESNHVWIYQGDIALMRGQYRWIPYKGKGLSDHYYSWLKGKSLTPNYVWLNTYWPKRVLMKPSEEDPEEAVFAVRDVPPFDDEPESLPDIALQGQLRLYYSSAEAAEDFWRDLSKNVIKAASKFCTKNDRVREVVAQFSDLESDEAKREAAYSWLQANIKNTTYMTDGRDDEDMECVDDVIKKGRGTRWQINLVFLVMLRVMDIEARIAFAVDRDEAVFVPEAKYWQFDRCLVAVPEGPTDYRFHSPGDLHLPSGWVPWYNEGVKAIVPASDRGMFVAVPSSEAESNREHRIVSVQVGEDLGLRGKLTCMRSGHRARAVRLLFSLREQEAEDEIREQLEKLLPQAEIDSISVEGLEDDREPVMLSCMLGTPGLERSRGGRLLLRPFSCLSTVENPFHSETRNYPIALEYPYELVDVLKIDLPGDITVEGLPSDTTFANQVGLCEARFALIGQTLSVQRLIRLSGALWSSSDYASVRALCETPSSLDGLLIVLREDIRDQ